MVEVTIELSDEQVRVLARCFRGCRFDDTEELAGRFALLAVEAWVDWLAGDRRYKSLTDQYTDWIETLYTRVLSEEEAPAVDRLYNYFNIPYGQAQYIARVLSNKQLTHWRRRAVEKLKEAMGDRLEEVEEWIADGETEAKAEIIVDKLGYLELKSLHAQLFETNPEDMARIKFQATGDLYSILILASCFRTLYEAVTP